MCITRIPLAALTGLLLALPAAAKDIDDMTLEERILQVVYNTIHQKQHEDSPPKDVVDRWRLAGTGDLKVYEYNIGDLEDDDYKQIGWRFQVRVLPPDWKPDEAAQAKWAEKSAGIDKETEGERAFLESQRGVRRTKVYFRLHRGNIKLVMSITREGKETQDEAVKKAERRWHFFVAEAIRHNLFERARIIVKALRPVDKSGKGIPDDPIGDREAFENGEFISIVHDHKQVVDLPLRIQVEAADVVDDEPYELRVAFKDTLGRPGVQLVDAGGAALADRDEKGRYIVKVPRGDTPAAMSIRFGTYSLGHGAGLRGKVLDQLAQAQFQYLGKPEEAKGTDAAPADPDPKAKLDVAVQRGDWWPVVTRFEIKTKFVSDSPGFKRKKEGEFKEDRFRGSFNAYRIHGGDLKAGWDLLLPLVRARPGYPEGAFGSSPAFKQDDAVILGWRRHPRNPGHFFTAESSPERPWVPGFKALGRNSFHLLVDVKIVAPSPPPSKEENKRKMPFGDMGDGAFGDPFAAEREIRRFINVGDYKLSIRRLAAQGVFIPANAKPGAAYEKFAGIIRLTSGGIPFHKGGKEREVILEQRRSGKQNIERYFPVEAHRKEALQYRDVYCTPGVYEVRLFLDLYYKEPDNSKKLNVALRYNCVGRSFRVDTLSYTSTRQTKKKGK